MAAVSATLLSLLGPGDHLLTQVGPHTHPHARQGCRRRPVAALGLPASRRRSGGAAAGRPPPRAGLSQPEEAPARRAGRCVRRHVGADARRARAARHHAHRRRPARAGHVAGRATADHQGARGCYSINPARAPRGPGALGAHGEGWEWARPGVPARLQAAGRAGAHASSRAGALGADSEGWKQGAASWHAGTAAGMSSVLPALAVCLAHAVMLALSPWHRS